MSRLTELTTNVKAAISQVSDVAALGDVRVEYLGKEGHLTLQMTTLRELPPEKRPAVGVVVNGVREQVQQALNVCKAGLKNTVLDVCLVVETTDVSPSDRRIENSGLHPVTRTIDRIESFSDGLGPTVATGSEIEDNYRNFDALNIPDHHPVCADHDTFWFDATRLLCTQTSNVQIRTMKTQQPPIHIIAPGRVYCNDYSQTHTPVLRQMEGPIVDTNIGFIGLKGTPHDFLCNLSEEDLQIRFHPSYFPFTEPSVEVDVMGKSGRQLEVLGCGVVHLNVLRNASIDPEVYSGFTFGMGTERLTMLCYGVTDLRPLFENDLCFLKQFK